MNFLHENLLIPVVVIIFIFCILYLRNFLKFNTWIKRYWGVRLKTKGYISIFFFLTGLILLSLTLLDPRGEAQNIKASIKEAKTIIMIDNSASMLAEDIRPNRLEKAVFLARHFAKSASGHQISVVVFSDIQKKIVPFTGDRELLDSRIDAISKSGAIGGGTNLTLSIQEAMTYFSKEEGSGGNLLIFTDAEESDSPIDLKIPKDINVAIVALGTAKGAPIPMRNKRGQLDGNKKVNGEEIITKLNTSELDSLAKQITNFKYWVANSYGLPTQEILTFFNNSALKTSERDNMKVQPVLAHYFQLPAIGLLILSLFFKIGRSYAPFYLLLLMFSMQGPIGYAQDHQEKQEKKEISPEDENRISQILGRYRQGFANNSELSELAEIYMKNKMYDKAKILFEKSKIDTKNIKNEFNYATTLLHSQEASKSFEKFLDIYERLKDTTDEKEKKILEDVKKNLALSANSSSGKNDKKEKGKSGEDSKDQSEENESGNDDKEKKDSKGDKKDDKKDDKKEEKKEQDKSDKEKDKDKDKQDKKEEKQPEQGEPQKPMEQKKVPGILKQLIDEDRKLQMKLMDTNTDKKNKQYRDW